ncbi:MAG TPA: hypothetical protein VEF71_15215, partial [Streptosporangiaceae bacterium]|nr:hypothetical protein [Streptosporangiaceae bacterium]
LKLPFALGPALFCLGLGFQSLLPTDVIDAFFCLLAAIDDQLLAVLNVLHALLIAAGDLADQYP